MGASFELHFQLIKLHFQLIRLHFKLIRLHNDLHSDLIFYVVSLHYRKCISGVRVVLWVKGTEYIWVGQLITHQGDMHII